MSLSYAEQLNAAYALAERRLGRKLTYTERQIDVIRIDRVMNRAKDELQALIDIEQARAVRAWVLWRRRVRLELTPGMVDVLARLHEQGRREALREIRKMGVEPKRAYADPVEWLLPHRIRVLAWILRKFLGHISIRSERQAVKADLGRASQAVIMKKANEVLGARDAASRIVSTAFTSGLAETYEQHADVFVCWQYTAVMDSGTCDPCRATDGRRYSSLDAAYSDLPDFGPNPFCLGDGRCRCRLVPCPFGEHA